MLLATLAGCTAAGGSGGACTETEIADLPVLNRSGSPVVPATLDGHRVALYVDTGTGLSAINRAAADRLGLTIDPRTRYVMAGVGGDATAPAVLVHRLELGGAEARDVRFAAAGPFDRTMAGVALIGLFGGDFLSAHDVEFDLPAHRIRVFDERDCPDDFSPLDGPVAAIPFRRGVNESINVTLRLDGAAHAAVLDSGASRTLVSDDEVPATAPGDKPGTVVGIAGMAEPIRFRRFATRAVGTVADGPVVLAVGVTPVTLLGADWFRRHAVWISYPHDTLFIPLAASAP